MNLSSEDPGGFVDTGLTPAVIDPRVYVSRQAVIDMARLFGMPDPDQFAEVLAAAEQLDHENRALREQLAEADRYAEAAEYTLKATFGSDAKIKNKPGRKPKVEA